MTAHEDHQSLAPYSYFTVPMQRLAATLPWYAAESTEPPDTSSDQYPMLWLNPETGVLSRYEYGAARWAPVSLTIASPNGTLFNITVDDEGNLSTTPAN